MKLSKVVSFIVLLGVLFQSQLSSAQQILSLENCVAMALQNNKSIQIAEEDLNKARGQITETKSGVFPTLTASGAFSYMYEQPTFTFPQPDSITEELVYTEIPVGEKDNYTISATLQQTIFNASVFIAPQAAKIFAKYSEQKVAATQQEIVLATKNAYFGVLLVQAFVDVQRQALEQAEATLERVRQYRATGQASDFDVLRAEVEVSNLWPELIRAQNSVELAMIQLKNTLSLDLNTELVLSDTLTYRPISISFEDAFETAEKRRPDLQALEYQIAGLKKYLTAQRSARLPTLTGLLEYNGQYDHYKVDGNNWEATIQGIVALNFNYVPFLDGGRTAGLIRQAAADHRKAQIGYDLTLDYVVLEIKQALLNTEESAKRIESAELGISRADEALKISELRYANGLNTQLEVRDTRLALTIARTNYIQALHDYNVARANLDKAMGIIN